MGALVFSVSTCDSSKKRVSDPDIGRFATSVDDNELVQQKICEAEKEGANIERYEQS